MRKIAILIDQMFEDSEFRVPYDRLRAAGHRVDIVGIEVGAKLVGKRSKELVAVEKAVGEVSAKDYDALVIPGGYSPDRLRTDARAVAFTREMGLANKPVAAICHAGSMLIEADVAYGRVLTSTRAIKTDLVNAGAHWVDRDVAIDGNIITSRKPDDLPAFCDVILHQLADGVPERAEPVLADTVGEHVPTIH